MNPNFQNSDTPTHYLHLHTFTAVAGNCFFFCASSHFQKDFFSPLNLVLGLNQKKIRLQRCIQLLVSQFFSLFPFDEESASRLLNFESVIDAFSSF